MRRPIAHAARMGGRIGVLALCAGIAATVAFQFAGIVGKNVKLARDIAVTDSQIDRFEAREREQYRTIERLRDPQGAIPAIHEKLQLVGPHEEIIYVRGLATPTPEATAEWEPQP